MEAEAPVFASLKRSPHSSVTLLMRNCLHKYALLAACLILAGGCAELPEYARPRTIQSENIHGDLSSGFGYRKLQREDFRAASLPGNMSTHGKNINAQSAITIRLTPDSKFGITPRQDSGRVTYAGSIHHLAFEAVMLPKSSWWNPELKEGLAGYVLQHEQIHFALTEVAARQLTEDSRKWASAYSVVKDTPQEVYSEITREIKVLINSAMDANKKRHLKFDEDTSLFYSPSWQAWWLEKVEKELSQTEPGAPGK